MKCRARSQARTGSAAALLPGHATLVAMVAKSAQLLGNGAHHGARLDVSHSSVRSRIGRRRRRWPASRRLEYWRLLLQRAENCEPDRLRRKWRSGEKGSATVCLLHIQNSKSRLKCVVDGKPLGWNIAESVATTAAARLAGGNLSHFSGQLWRGYGRHYGARQMRRSAARWSLC